MTEIHLMMEENEVKDSNSQCDPNIDSIAQEHDQNISNDDVGMDQPLNLNISDDDPTENIECEITKSKDSTEILVNTSQEQPRELMDNEEAVDGDLSTLKDKLQDIDAGADQLEFMGNCNNEDKESENSSENITTPAGSAEVSGPILEECDDSNSSESKEDTMSKKRFRNLLNSDSEDESRNDERTARSETSKNSLKMTAKEAELQRKAIKSETQRLTRETYISIPYHKPKRFTLQEFMQRKTVMKPTLLLQNIAQNKCSNPLIPKASKLKMTPEELEQYSNFLENRAKEATEFFKSEEENTEENKISTVDTKNDDDENNGNHNENSPSIKEHEGQISITENNENTTEPNVPTLNIEDLRRVLKEDESESPKITTPKLKGDSNMFVDLESGECITPKPSGVENLLNKLLKHSITKHRPSTPTVSVNILSTNNGILEMSKAKINVTKNDDDLVKLDQKPGLAYMKLKENLRNLITQKRKSELTKKVQEIQEIAEKEKNLEEEDDEDEVDADEADAVEENEDEGVINEDEDENNDEVDEDEDNDDADDELEENNDSGDDDDDVEENLNKKSKFKKRILRAFEDSDEENEDENKPINIDDTLPTSRFDSSDLDLEKSQLDLFSQQNYMQITQRNDVPTQWQKSVIISQIPTTPMSQAVDDNELMDLCSGAFTENPTQQKEPLPSQRNEDNDLQTSDDDEPDIFTTNKNKKKKKYRPIDDEDDDDNCTPGKNTKEQSDYEKSDGNDEDNDGEEKKEDDGDDDDEDEEAVETYIDYDSEENEIEVRLTKNERLEKANEFLENEAELSESEWDSADEKEDGKDFDKYDIELGDEDKFDQEELHDELEKIHMRKMLDQDIREVKKIQEMFFQDEENDGIGRQRQFKWKNLDNQDFTLDNNQKDDDCENGSGDDDDGQNEEYWRKMRHERQQLLKEKNLITEESSSIIQNINISGSGEGGGLGVGIKEIQLSHKKLTIMKPKENTTPTRDLSMNSPFLISKSEGSLKRASFLERGQDALSKLASFMKMNTEKDEDEEILCAKPVVNSRNFVFQVLSQEQSTTITKNLKRRMSEKQPLENKAKKQKQFVSNSSSSSGKKGAKT